MSPDDHVNPGDLALWRRVAAMAPAQPDPPSPCPSALELAAFVDGRLAEPEREAIETHLASCRSCLDAARAAREVMREPRLVLVPPDVLVAAQSLVAAPQAARSRRFAGTRALRWTLAAAAAIGISTAGYLAGLRSFGDEAGSDLVGEASFGFLSAAWADGPDDIVFASLIDEEAMP